MDRRRHVSRIRAYLQPELLYLRFIKDLHVIDERSSAISSGLHGFRPQHCGSFKSFTGSQVHEGCKDKTVGISLSQGGRRRNEQGCQMNLGGLYLHNKWRIAINSKQHNPKGLRMTWFVRWDYSSVRLTRGSPGSCGCILEAPG